MKKSMFKDILITGIPVGHFFRLRQLILPPETRTPLVSCILGYGGLAISGICFMLAVAAVGNIGTEYKT